jgi:hypothetical protein
MQKRIQIESKTMDTWWDLGEWYGSQGDKLSVHDVTCAFCLQRGKFKMEHHIERKSATGKVFNYETLQCENCGNFTMAFWSAGQSLHAWRTLPWPLHHNKFPESWPKDVGRFWLQAKNALLGKNLDSAAVMARSALQLSLRYSDANGESLFKEIEDLFNKGKLPSLMKEWAHEIRLLARDPAHPQPGAPATSQQEVHDIMNFLDFLLEYLFTLPSKISGYRDRKDKK